MFPPNVPALRDSRCVPCVSTKCTRIFILMSSPLVVARNESRTFRVCAFPSSRSLSPATFFIISPARPLYPLSNTYTIAPSNEDRHHLPPTLPPSPLTVTATRRRRRGRRHRHRPHDGNPTFPRNPYVADEGRYTCLPAYAYKCTRGHIRKYVRTVEKGGRGTTG